MTYESLGMFLKAKAKKLPANVRLFCHEIGEGVGQEDFFSPWKEDNTVTLSKAFGVGAFRAFVESLPIESRRVTLNAEAVSGEVDLSFLTTVVLLNVNGISDCALRVPTSLVELELDYKSKNVTVSGVENLTGLTFAQCSFVVVESCPKLRQLECHGRTCPARMFQFCDVTTLSAMTVMVDTIHADCRFPAALRSLNLSISHGFYESNLSGLTALQKLFVGSINTTPVDLSCLVSMTHLDAHHLCASGLPTSLVDATLWVSSDTDFSALTALTSLNLQTESDCHITFPSQLKKLKLSFLHWRTVTTNSADLSLDFCDIFPFQYLF